MLWLHRGRLMLLLLHRGRRVLLLRRNHGHRVLLLLNSGLITHLHCRRWVNIAIGGKRLADGRVERTALV